MTHLAKRGGWWYYQVRGARERSPAVLSDDKIRQMVALDPVCLGESDLAFLIRIGAGRWIANGAVPLSHE